MRGIFPVLQTPLDSDGELDIASLRREVRFCAAEHARHAARTKAQAVMALPPYITSGTPDEILDYYRAIGRAAELPIFVQNAAPGLSPDFLIRLSRIT